MKTAMSYWRHYAKDNRSGSKGSVNTLQGFQVGLSQLTRLIETHRFLIDFERTVSDFVSQGEMPNIEIWHGRIKTTQKRTHSKKLVETGQIIASYRYS